MVEKIIEYEKIRTMAKSLDRLPVLGRDAFVREPGASVGEEEDVLSLCTLFLQLIRSRQERFISISEIRPTLEEKLEEIKNELEREGTYVISFDLEQELRTTVAVILAVLEIAKLKLALLSQKRPFGTIILKKR